MSENIENVQIEDAIVQDIKVEATAPAEEKPKVEELPTIEFAKVEEIKPEPVRMPQPSSKTVVIYSLKDLTVPGLGSIKKGYNKVSEKDAEKWLVKNSVRLAKEEEIKLYLK